MQQDIVFTIFLIFTGAAVVSTLALYARQALLVAYILVGVLMGPSVLGLVDDAALIREIAHIGIMFLLFLMGQGFSLTLFCQFVITPLRLRRQPLVDFLQHFSFLPGKAGRDTSGT